MIFAENASRHGHHFRLKLDGEESRETLRAASNYATSLAELQRFKEARSVLRKSIPVARRVLGESDELTLRMMWIYGEALYLDDSATLDDLRESVTTLEDLVRIARRVLGTAHPLVENFEIDLQRARAARDALQK